MTQVLPFPILILIKLIDIDFDKTDQSSCRPRAPCTYQTPVVLNPKNTLHSILLLETPCSLVGSSVTFFTLSNTHDISATKRATGDPLVSKRPDFGNALSGDVDS